MKKRRDQPSKRGSLIGFGATARRRATPPPLDGGRRCASNLMRNRLHWWGERPLVRAHLTQKSQVEAGVTGITYSSNPPVVGSISAGRVAPDEGLLHSRWLFDRLAVGVAHRLLISAKGQMADAEVGGGVDQVHAVL